jgi:hypothetical protein
MKTSARRKLGVAMIIIALLSLPALWISGVPLLSLTSSEKTESQDS